MKLTRRSFLKATSCSAIAITAGLSNPKSVLGSASSKADKTNKQFKIISFSTTAFSAQRLESKSIDFYVKDNSYWDDGEEFPSLMQERSKRPPYANKIRKMIIEG